MTINAQTKVMSISTMTDLGHLSQSLIELVAKAASGVVAVKTAPHKVVSGVVLRNDLIAVADHSLRREGRVKVQSHDGSQYAGEVAGRDPSLDAAIVRVEGAHLTPLTAVDPGSLKTGALAAVIGMTMDVGPSASLGILGAVSGNRRTWRGGTLDHFFRLDVNLYPSQLGAAVVDGNGHLIGLATPGLLRHSSVAVPVITLNRIVDEIIKEGRVRHGYLGIGLQPVAIPAHLREKLGLNTEVGLILLSIEPDSPAHLAALQLGDILLSLNEQPVGEVEDLQAMLRGEAIGKALQLKLLRGGELLQTQVTVAERPKKGS